MKIQHYTGFNVAYNGDDFAQNRVTIYKEFEQSGIYFMLYYTTGIRVIHITARREVGLKVSTALSTMLINDCVLDVIKQVCQELISKLNEQAN